MENKKHQELQKQTAGSTKNATNLTSQKLTYITGNYYSSGQTPTAVTIG